VPIFVRSEALGAFKIKVCFKYSPTSSIRGSDDINSTSNIDVSTTITETFELTCNVVRPIGVSFNLSSNRDANCGVSSEMASNSILRGDDVSLTSTITCTRPCKMQLGIVDVALIQSTDGESLFRIKSRNMENEKRGIEVRAESKEASSNSNLRVSSSLLTLLSNKESFSTCIDVHCMEEINTSMKPQLPCASTSATIGTLGIQWRLEDQCLLFPASSPSPSSLKSLEDIHKYSNILPFSGDSGKIVNKNVSYTRICVMNFSIPPVHVLDAPFDVSLDAPATLLHGETATISINVYNKLLSSERIGVNCETVDYILISGFVKTTTTLSPKSSSKIQFSIVPLQHGQLRLPKITLVWERHNLNVMEIGGSGSAKAIYVRPKGVQQ